MNQISFRGNDYDIDIPDWVNDNYRKRKAKEEAQRREAQQRASRAQSPQNRPASSSYNSQRAKSSSSQNTRRNSDGDTYVSRREKREAIKRQRRNRLLAGAVGLFTIINASFFGGFNTDAGGKTTPDPVIPETGIVETYEGEQEDGLVEGDTIYVPETPAMSEAPDDAISSEIIRQTDPCFDFEVNLCDEQEYALNKFMNNWNENKERYEYIESKTGIPAELVAAIHWREGSGNFNRCLTDGTPIGQPVTSPLCKGKIYSSFEESAIDVLSQDFLQNIYIEKGNYQSYLDFAERYNGTGYRVYHGINSPYVWAGTEKYTCGKYTSDGKYDPNYVDTQLGVAVMLKNILA